MSTRRQQFLDLATSCYTRGIEHRDTGNHSAAADSFQSAADFMNSALRELDPTISDLPGLDTPPAKLHRPVVQTGQLSVIADHHN